jgi:hypothetical protein
MPQVEFEPTAPVFEHETTVRVSDRWATVIYSSLNTSENIFIDIDWLLRMVSRFIFMSLI